MGFLSNCLTWMRRIVNKKFKLIAVRQYRSKIKGCRAWSCKSMKSMRKWEFMGDFKEAGSIDNKGVERVYEEGSLNWG